MGEYRKQSPIRLPGHPAKTERRDGWEVALAYDNEDAPVVVIDLSHTSKWEIYDRQLEGRTLGPVSIPYKFGDVTLAEGLVTGLVRPSVALVWQLDGGRVDLSGEAGVTEVTDGYALLALIGDDGPRVMEKICDLDLERPSKQHVHLIQGPILGAPAKIMVFSAAEPEAGMLIAVARGSGQSIADALLDAGAAFGLRPAGEGVFTSWLQRFIRAPNP